jgi:hypothetical protein
LPSGAITYDSRLAKSGRVCISASKPWITVLASSDATGKRLWHDLTENFDKVSMSSADTPITVAPSAANLSMASAKAWASMEQSFESAAGKKYTTTGPLASASASE